MKKRTALVALSLALGMGMASAAKLTVWTHYGDAEAGFLRDAARRFAATPAAQGNTFDIVNVDFGQMKQKMILGAPKGEGPDLLASLPQDQLGELVAAGVLEPMDKYLPAAARSDYPASALNAMTYQGKLFGVPIFGEAVAVIYNKKLVPSVPTTWDAFIKKAQELTKPEIGQFGFNANIEEQYSMHGLYYAFGGYVFKQNGGTYDVKDVGLANAGANRAGQLINDLRYKFNLVPDGAADQNVAKSAFVDGKVAMWLTGPWQIADIKKAGIDFGIALLPKPTGAIRNWAPFLGVQGIMLNSYSKAKDVSAAFARFLTSPENQAAYYTAGGRIVVSKKAAAQLASDPVIAGFNKAISQGVPMPNIPAMGQVWGPWGNAVTLIAKTPSADVKALNAAAVKEISSNIK